MWYAIAGMVNCSVWRTKYKFLERILSIVIMTPVCTGFYHFHMHDDIKIQSDSYWYFLTMQSILIIWLLKYGMTTHVNLLIYFLTY